jgi:hypothetical protein
MQVMVPRIGHVYYGLELGGGAHSKANNVSLEAMISVSLLSLFVTMH